MSDRNTPNDAGKFTMIAFIAFAVVFVFAMMMMLWHGNFQYTGSGEVHYNTQVNEP